MPNFMHNLFLRDNVLRVQAVVRNINYMSGRVKNDSVIYRNQPYASSIIPKIFLSWGEILKFFVDYILMENNNSSFPN